MSKQILQIFQSIRFHKKRVGIFIGFFIILMILLSQSSIFRSFIITAIKQNELKPAQTSPTPFPFQEVTIPALRKRTYKSALNNRVLYEKHDQYTSYLTSYDSDGLKINGLLTIPNGETPANGWPAIVFVHG